MNPDTNMPPVNGPGIPAQPSTPMQGQMPPMPNQQSVGIPMQPIGQSMEQPANWGDLPMQSPQPPMGAAPQDQVVTQPGVSMQPEKQSPAPAPQPMFTPMTGPVPGQPMSTTNQPIGQPIMPIQQPAFTPMAASQMPSSGSKKKLFIIGGVILAILLAGGSWFMFFSRSALVGSLTADSYKGLNYKRPASWVKDTSASSVVTYHPKQSVGKGSDGKSTYALKMDVNAEENIFSNIPDNLDADYKKTLQQVVDNSVASAAADILPNKADVGCDSDPTYKEKPKKVNVSNSFWAISYSFTCKVASDSGSDMFYFSVVDLVPNNKNVEYVIEIGAASQSIYNTNQSKINEILNSVSF